MARVKKPTYRKKHLQIVYSQSQYLLDGKYLSPKGQRLLTDCKTKAEKNEIWRKYGKKRYKLNPKAKPVAMVQHRGMRPKIAA